MTFLKHGARSCHAHTPSYNNTIGIRSDPKHVTFNSEEHALLGDMIMLNLATSFVTTMLSLVIGLLSYLKGPFLLLGGIATLVLVLSSPAEAAQIKCALNDCPPISCMIWERKLALLLLLTGSLITTYLLITTEKGE